MVCGLVRLIQFATPLPNHGEILFEVVQINIIVNDEFERNVSQASVADEHDPTRHTSPPLKLR